jgi:hypothetical protein
MSMREEGAQEHVLEHGILGEVREAHAKEANAERKVLIVREDPYREGEGEEAGGFGCLEEGRTPRSSPPLPDAQHEPHGDEAEHGTRAGEAGEQEHCSTLTHLYGWCVLDVVEEVCESQQYYYTIFCV